MAVTRSSTGNSKDRGMLQQPSLPKKSTVKGSKVEKPKKKNAASKAQPKSKTTKGAEMVAKAEMNGHVSWTAPTEVHSFNGLLFDFDGKNILDRWQCLC